jgi:hypothetical protein
MLQYLKHRQDKHQRCEDFPTSYSDIFFVLNLPFSRFKQYVYPTVMRIRETLMPRRYRLDIVMIYPYLEYILNLYTLPYLSAIGQRVFGILPLDLRDPSAWRGGP